MTTYYTHTTTPVGRLLLLHANKVITGIYWEAFSRIPEIQDSWVEESQPFTNIIQQLSEYFAGKRTEFELPLFFAGTDFQKQVWQQVVNIPYGKSVSYKAIAEAIGKPKAVRAVGTAVGSNPLCIVAPCHRVLPSSGGIGGYAGGAEAKRHLLQLEHIRYSE